MRRREFLGLGVVATLGMVAAVPVMAQSLGDVGRLLQDQVAPRPNPGYPPPDRNRDAYEQGRRDQEEQARRERDARRDDHYRDQDDRRRNEDARRYERDSDRQRAERERELAEERRAREQPGRY